MPPTNEPTAAATSAQSAFPFMASGRPSKTVATAVEAPGYAQHYGADGAAVHGAVVHRGQER